jgi:hypothetical protein
LINRDEDDGWVDDGSPWYNMFLARHREYVWNALHKYDDPDE